MAGDGDHTKEKCARGEPCREREDHREIWGKRARVLGGSGRLGFVGFVGFVVKMDIAVNERLVGFVW